jgi:predicted RNase H-like nuclease (RuvC/YqgF family)
VGALEVLIPVLVAVVSVIGTVFATKSTNKKDLTVSDRQLLSEDERNFRQELKDSINMYKTEIVSLRDETKAYKQEIIALRDEVRLLREVNLHLEVENQKLVIKVEELSQQIIKLERSNSKEELEARQVIA